MRNFDTWALLMQSAANAGGGVISLVGSGVFDANSDGTSFTVLNLSPGDMVIISASSDTQIIAIPSGWTGYSDPGTGSASIRSAYFYQFATGSSVSVSNLSGTTGGYSVAYIWQVFRGVDTSSPIHQVNNEIGTSGMPDPPAITTSINGCAILILGMLDDDQVESSVTAPSGFTLIQPNEARYTTNMSAWLLQEMAGAIDPGAFGGGGSDAKMAYTIALKPG